MKRQLFHVAIAAAIVCVVLAPALIWSGQRSSAAGEDFGVFKDLPFFTVGPPMTAEELASREAEKRLSILEGQTWFGDNASDFNRPETPPSEPPRETLTSPAADRPGLTPTEMAKLAAIRSGAFQPREDRGTWPPKPELQVEKLDVPLRALGPEGLTPEEKSKLEASRARGEKAGRDEGGRSR
jgi:hypothetical protein